MKKKDYYTKRYNDNIMTRGFWVGYQKGAQMTVFTHEGKRMAKVLSVDKNKPRVKLRVQGFQTDVWAWFCPDKDGHWFMGSWKLKSCREPGYSGWKHWHIVPLGGE